MRTKLLGLCLLALSLLSTAQNCPIVTAKDANNATSVNLNCNSVFSPSYSTCFAATVDYPSFRNTNTYDVQVQPYTPPIAYNAGTAIVVNDDDKFVYNLSLPFSFCFFGQNYNNIILGTNAKISFNQRMMGNVDFPNYTQQNPNVALGLSTIFAASQDLVFSSAEGSGIFYSIEGQAPCRKVIVNFYNGRLVGCTQRYSSQIVLHENTNAIEIFYQSRTAPCSTVRFTNALVGIIDATGTMGYSPANRNTGNWTSGDEAYIFQPSGANVIPTINWYDSANKLVASGKDVRLCPSKSETYSVKVNYALCQNGSYILTDELPVNVSVDLPSPSPIVDKFCMNTSGDYAYDMRNYEAQINPNPANFIFAYYPSIADAIANTNVMPRTGTVTSAGLNFVVKVSNPNNPNCYKINNISFTKYNQVIKSQSVKLCDFRNDGIEPNYLLTQFNRQVIPNGYTGPISYHATEADARNNINPITRQDLVNAGQVFLRLTDANCSYVHTLTVDMKGSPLFNQPVTYQTEMCDYNADDQEPFDWKRIFASLITNDPTVVDMQFYYSYQEAFDGGAGLSTIKPGNYTVYVRLENANKCFSIAEISMTVVFNKIVVNPVEINLCFDGTRDFNLNLNDYSATMLVSPLDGSVLPLSYHGSQAEAEININPISNLQSITEDGDLVQRTYFVRFANAAGCYTIRPINVFLVHPVIQGLPEVCDTNNDRTETVNPNAYSLPLIGTQGGAQITYFATQADANANINPLTSITLNPNKILFAKIDFRGCSKVWVVIFVLKPTPVLPQQIDVTASNLCDNNADGIEPINLTNYYSQIYNAGPSEITFYETYDRLSNSLSNPIATPTAYLLRASNPLIYANVRSIINECSSVTALNFRVNFYPPIVLKEATLQQCNVTFQTSTTYDLTQAIRSLFIQADNQIPLASLQVSYHANMLEANSGQNPIPTTYTTELTRDAVYVRFYNPSTQCYSTAKINILTYTPPKALNSTIQVCDNNLDGMYDVNLLNYLDQIPAVISPDNKFSFYLTQDDALNRRNAIATPQNFTALPFPNRIYVRIENIIDCNDINVIDFSFGAKVEPNKTQLDLILCDIDNDNKEEIDLSQIESQLTLNTATATFQYYLNMADVVANKAIADPKKYMVLQNQQNFVAKISAPNLCPVAVNINVRLIKTPILSIASPLVCPGEVAVINPDVTGLDVVSYNWLNAQGQSISTQSTVGVSTAGPYSLVLTNSNNCSYTAKFNLLHKPVPNIISLNLIDEQTGVYVQAMGLEKRKIEYSIDGKNWQKESTFDNVPKGVSTFYVRYENDDCFNSKQILIPFIYNILTPQNDGVNDTWVLEGLEVFGKEKSKLEIYDRYQRLLYKTESNTKFEWNGHFDQRVEPSAAYWYIIDLPDGRQYTGWIVVKNRH